MKRENKHKKDDTSFKGEMIKNELFRSADDVLDSDSNGDYTEAMMGDFSAARSLKEKTRTQLKVDQDEYSIRVSYQIAKKSGSMLRFMMTRITI